MDPRDALGEAWRNITSGTSRALLLSILLTLTVGGVAAAEVQTLAHLVKDAHAYQASGANTLILEAQGRVDGASCSRVHSISGVSHSAAVSLEGHTVRSSKLPMQAIPRVVVTPDMAGILGVQPVGAGVWLSKAVADQLGAAVGQSVVLDGTVVPVAAIYSLPDDGRRTGLGYAIVDPQPASGAFDECWVQAWPVDDALASMLVSAAPTRSDEAGTARRTLSQWNKTRGTSFDARGPLDHRATAWAWFVGLLLGVAVGFGAIRSRRLELAAARHAGLDVTTSVFIAVVELLLPLCAMVVLSSGLLMWLVHDVEPGERLDILVWGWRILWYACLGVPLGGALAVFSVRESHLFALFKGR